jgi:DNA-binding SARP family transcriptional activator
VHEPPTDLTTSLLGPVRAWNSEGEVWLGHTRRRTVFAVLALHANQQVSHNELIEAVWGDDAPASAIGDLHTYVHALGTAIEPERARRSRNRILVSEKSGYCLRLTQDALDVHHCQALCDRANELLARQDLAGALAALDEALGLWRGDALDGARGPFADTQRARLADLRLTVIEQRAQLMIATGAHLDVAHELRTLVRAHPLHDGLRGLLMRALHLAGERLEALAAFEELRSATAERPEVAPGPDLTGLYQLIRADHPGLGDTTRSSPVLPRTRTRLAGRDGEVARLRAAVRATAAGTGGSLLLEGAAGIGKSALLAAGLADPAGCRVGRGVATEAGREAPLGAVLSCLDAVPSASDAQRAELARLTRLAHALDHAAATDAVTDLVERWSAERPLILVLDQLQWADPLSLEVWRCLAAATSRLPLLLVAAGRPSRYRPEHDRTEVITIGPLSDDAVRDLVTEFVGAPADRTLVELCRSAAGHPRYLLDLLECLDLEKRPGIGEPLPSSLVRAIVDRLAHLSPRARNMLRRASLFHGGFTEEELAVALDGTVAEPIREALLADVLTSSAGVLSFRHPLAQRALRESHPEPVHSALWDELVGALYGVGAHTGS